MPILLKACLYRQPVETTNPLLKRVRRLEEEQAQFRSRLEGHRQLRIFAAHTAAAAQTATILGQAIEAFAQAMRSPLPRGRAGGLARTRSAWRYFDGTFMPESEKALADLEDYERHAAGGRARAAKAQRAVDGTFVAANE